MYIYLQYQKGVRSDQCWPSYATIGAAVGMSRNTVQKHVCALVDKDLIQTEDTTVRQKNGLPPEMTERKKFADLFVKFNEYLEAAKVQGFTWDKPVYEFDTDNSEKKKRVEVALTEVTYKILVQRYKELFTPDSSTSSKAGWM